MNATLHRMMTYSVLAAAICAGGCGSNGTPPPTPSPSSPTNSTSPDFSAAMMQSMAVMDKNMAAAPMTGDPDRDFAAMMIPHHQGAIEMAKPYLAAGTDPALRRLAEEIVVTQQQEIDVMQRRLDALNAGGAAAAATQPAELQAASPVAVSSHDRVYTGDQTSNTVSVIDPGTNKLLGIIRLGDPVPGSLSALYRGQLLVHGIGFSPDHRTIAVVSIGSNSVTFIDTATNKVKGVTYVGRSPHEAFFTPDGKELWVAVRGEDYVAILDATTMKETRRVKTANGPAMMFSPDGKYAYVPSSFTPELAVVDTQTYSVIARVPQASPFSPNLAVSQDGNEVWFTLKDSGQTQVMTGQPPFRIVSTLQTGPISNHVALVDNADGKFAYITVGGENAVKVFRRGAAPQQIATISTGDLPHGIWPSGDGSRVYVGLENQDAVIAIDTHTNQILATIPIGLQPQALVYVPNAVPEGEGTADLMPLGDAGKAAHLAMQSPDANGTAKATVSVNAVGPLDLLQIAATGFEPGQMYTLWLTSSRTPPFKEKQPLGTFKANLAGAVLGQTVAPLRQVLTSPDAGKPASRYLLLTKANEDSPLLVQSADQP